MDHRSISQLKTFRRCGESYRLRRTAKHLIEEPPAAWTAVGTAFHTAYESYEISGRAFKLGELFAEEFDHLINEYQEREPDLKKWTRTPNVKTTERDIELRRDAGIKQAEVYQEHCEIADWKIWVTPDGEEAIELPIEVAFGSLIIKGAIDVVLKWPDGTLTIRDIKTGRRETDSTQLGVYAYAVNQLWGRDIKHGEFWYTKDGANREVNLERYTEDYLHDQFTKLDAAIKSEIYLANPGEQCKMCDVRPWCREMGWK